MSSRGHESTGTSAHLPVEWVTSLAAVGHVARALVGATTLGDVAERGLGEMRAALALDLAVLYVPDAAGRPILLRHAAAVSDGLGMRAADEIAFDEAAWQLAFGTGAPLVFHEQADWLISHPFRPAASSWLVLPLNSGGRLLGVVIAAASTPIALSVGANATLTLLGDLLTAGIETAELRRSLARIALDRERVELAGLVHDGIAQDLALAMRELALLESDPDGPAERASMERLRTAVAAAHETVRARLKELSTPLPIGGVQATVTEICRRFEARGLDLHLGFSGSDAHVRPAGVVAVARVLTEALANAERHAPGAPVSVTAATADGTLTLRIEDEGPGFVASAAGGTGDGHFGLMLMRKRAREGAGDLELVTSPGKGTIVTLQIPA